MNNNLQQKKCRLCSSLDINEVFCLGNCLIDGVYVEDRNKDIPYETFTLMKCNNCGLVQLKEIIDTTKIYNNYRFSSTNTRYILEWMNFLSELLYQRFGVVDKEILEIGASDGCFLQFFKDKNSIFGIEPSNILVKQAKEKYNIDLDNGFFGKSSYKEKQFDVILCRHVLEHIENVNDFISNMIRLCRLGGYIYIEVPDNDAILNNLNYSSLFHEHINYFTSDVLISLFRNFGFEVILHINNEINGGSFGILFKKILKKNDYNDMKNKINEDYNDLKKILDKKKYKKIMGYGAANKTFKLISIFGLEDKLICIYDKNKNLEKSFIAVPGGGIEIKSPTDILNDNPDLIILFATSYQNEIINYLKSDIMYSGDIITLNPKVGII